MASWHHTHFKVSSRQDGTCDDGQPRIVDRFACRYESTIANEAKPGTEPTCPKCSAAWTAAKDPERFAEIVFERVEDPPLRNARALYRVRRGAEAQGFVTIDAGFGRRWRVCALSVRHNDLDGPVQQGEDLRTGLHSKEYAALVLLDMVADGSALSETETRARAKDKAAAWARERADRGQFVRETEANRALVTDALGELLAQRKDLTNLQTMALQTAIRLIASTDVDDLAQASNSSTTSSEDSR